MKKNRFFALRTHGSIIYPYPVACVPLYILSPQICKSVQKRLQTVQKPFRKSPFLFRNLHF